ncbi:isochorismatase family cysteine hydrolase [Sphingobium sp. SJ10-10]|uniref:isochorismatase family cysteine hydrolase n=1 Tax=Sphingobium sp. SJ10-10 TaxID=3114999 RepID=UPI002E19E021|nr:isochorismatase family cysteine hydrolase [Sphingobium sp. SJ10-10]
MLDSEQTTGPDAAARDRAGGAIALLIIDMINSFDFEGAGLIQPKAAAAADAILALRSTVEQAGWPVVYVNDNFGEWHSEKSRLVDRALAKANPVTAKLKPEDQDYFIIKPQFSGFYATNLQVLLPKLGVSRLILTGIASDICILFTAADAHMRDYALWIPEDTVAAEQDERGAWALEIMRESMGAETAPTTDLTLQDWTARLNEAGIR